MIPAPQDSSVPFPAWALRWLLGFWLVGALPAVADPASVVGVAESRTTIAVDAAQGIRVQARQAPMGRMLAALAAETHIPIHIPAGLDTGLTATCAAASIKPLLACLLGPDANLMFRYEQGRPAEIWVLAAGTRPVATVAPPLPKSGLAAEPPSVEQLLAQATGGDAEQRATALGRLIVDGRVDAAELRGALETALGDSDPEVRAQAVFGLTRQGGDTTPEVLWRAFEDPDESVRMTALDGAGEDAQGLALLRQALADRAADVREFAALKLDSLSGAAGR